MRRAASIALALALSIGCGWAQDPALESVLQKMRDSEKKTKDMSFRFIQEVAFPATKESQHFEGTVLFKKPNKLKVTYALPVAQEITSDGKKIWVYTPQYNQVVEDSWAHWQKSGALPAGLLTFSSPVEDLTQQYHVRLIESSDKGAKLELIPKQEGLEGLSLKLTLVAPDYFPMTTLFSAAQFVSKTELFDLKVNQGLSDGLFRFRAPKGTNVERIKP